MAEIEAATDEQIAELLEYMPENQTAALIARIRLEQARADMCLTRDEQEELAEEREAERNAAVAQVAVLVDLFQQIKGRCGPIGGVLWVQIEGVTENLPAAARRYLAADQVARAVDADDMGPILHRALARWRKAGGQ